MSSPLRQEHSVAFHTPQWSRGESVWCVGGFVPNTRFKIEELYLPHAHRMCSEISLSLPLPPRPALSLSLSLSQSLLPNVPSYKQLDTLAVPDDGGRGGGWYLMELQSHQRLQVSDGSAHPSRRTHTLECFQSAEIINRLKTSHFPNFQFAKESKLFWVKRNKQIKLKYSE